VQTEGDLEGRRLDMGDRDDEARGSPRRRGLVFGLAQTGLCLPRFTAVSPGIVTQWTTTLLRVTKEPGRSRPSGGRVVAQVGDHIASRDLHSELVFVAAGVPRKAESFCDVAWPLSDPDGWHLSDDVRRVSVWPVSADVPESECSLPKQLIPIPDDI